MRSTRFVHVDYMKGMSMSSDIKLFEAVQYGTKDQLIHLVLDGICLNV